MLMDWKKLQLPDGAKLFRVHTFTYMHSGSTYHLEVDEFNASTFTGHGEHSTDKSRVLESVTGGSLEDCLTALIRNIKK
jgi:hypothetical protein